MEEIIYNSYRNLKLKDKPYVRDRAYLDIMINSLCSMFKYECNDKTVKNAINNRLEYFLRMYGKVGFFIGEDGTLKFGRAVFGGGVDGVNWEGESDTAIVTTRNGEVFEGKIGETVALIKNNMLGHSEINLQRFAEQLSEVDRSQVDLLINARSHPIILANNEQTAKRINNAIHDMKDGQPITVHSDFQMTQGVMGNKDENAKVLNLTDPQTATLFQYYTHYHEDLCGRLYGCYGLSTFNTGKMAQTNNLEVSGSLASSLCLPIHNYNTRLVGIEMVNEMFGLGLSIDWGDVWKNQIALLNSTDEIRNMSADTSGEFEKEGVNDEAHD